MIVKTKIISISKRIIGLAFALMLVVPMSACLLPPYKIYEEGCFQYIITDSINPSSFAKEKNKKAVAIVLLTEIGKEQEILDIPRAIDGLEVQYLGYPIIRGGLMAGDQVSPIESLNLKKIYMYDNIIWIEDYVLWETKSCDIMVLCNTIDNLTNMYSASREYSDGYMYVYI